MALPNMVAVSSSNIREMGHQGSSLWVRFANGQLWCYRGVPKAKAIAMRSAGSVGSYFAREIKPHYQGTKVEG